MSSQGAAAFAHLVYVSAYLKCHFPAIFATALINAQPMGCYQVASIVTMALPLTLLVILVGAPMAPPDALPAGYSLLVGGDSFGAGLARDLFGSTTPGGTVTLSWLALGPPLVAAYALWAGLSRYHRGTLGVLVGAPLLLLLRSSRGSACRTPSCPSLPPVFRR